MSASRSSSGEGPHAGTRAIITYHSIDPSGSVVSVAPDTFKGHVEWLCRAGVPVLPLDELLAPGTRAGVALTFDDGFENFASVAWPILAEHGLTATVFVVSDRVGGDNGWDPDDRRIPRLPLMDWSTLTGLARQGVELGSHSRSHADMTFLDDGRLRSELRDSAERIHAETGVRADSFAYPYGRFDESVARGVRDAGYGRAVTTELGLLDGRNASPYVLPRLDAYYLRRPGTLERWGSAGFRRYVRWRAGGRRVRAALARVGRR